MRVADMKIWMKTSANSKMGISSHMHGSQNNGANEKKESKSISVLGLGIVNEWNKRVCPSFLTHYKVHISRLLHGHVSCTISSSIVAGQTRGKLVNDLAQLEACKHVSLMGVVASSIQFMETLSRLLCQSHPLFRSRSGNYS